MTLSDSDFRSSHGSTADYERFQAQQDAEYYRAKRTLAEARFSEAPATEEVHDDDSRSEDC